MDAVKLRGRFPGRSGMVVGGGRGRGGGGAPTIAGIQGMVRSKNTGWPSGLW